MVMSQEETREASQVERELNEVSEDTATLLALLLKNIKTKLPPDLQVKVGENPDVSIKVGDQEVFRGKESDPIVDHVEAGDLEYVKAAISKAQGFKHSDFDRDVQITIKGQTVFELKGGEVVLNQIGPERNNVIHLNLDGVAPTLHDPKATVIQPPGLIDHGIETIDMGDIPPRHDWTTVVDSSGIQAEQQPQQEYEAIDPSDPHQSKDVERQREPEKEALSPEPSF